MKENMPFISCSTCTFGHFHACKLYEDKKQIKRSYQKVPGCGLGEPIKPKTYAFPAYSMPEA